MGYDRARFFKKMGQRGILTTSSRHLVIRIDCMAGLVGKGSIRDKYNVLNDEHGALD